MSFFNSSNTVKSTGAESGDYSRRGRNLISLLLRNCMKKVCCTGSSSLFNSIKFVVRIIIRINVALNNTTQKQSFTNGFTLTYVNINLISLLFWK